ncbi:hypothetical protein ACLB2K_029732 [Fragaria x ananassa]
MQAAVYKTGSVCSAFLANVDTKSDATVTFNGNSYQLPAWSVSILPDCKNVVLNTAKVCPLSLYAHDFLQRCSEKSDVEPTEAVGSGWSWINEPVGISKGDAFTRVGLLEQINTTADKSDYLWYSTSIDVKGGYKADLHVQSLGHALHAFVRKACSATVLQNCPSNESPSKLRPSSLNYWSNGSGTGNSGNAKVSVEIPVEFASGKNTIDLLSPEGWASGSAKGTTIDLSSQQWTYQIGLKGEDKDLPSGSSQWISQPTLPKNQPLMWYKTQFDSPGGSNPVAIDFTGMGKGEAWVNGQSIGRYWPTNVAPKTGCTDCNYRGAYSADKCRKNCGMPSQKLYHVPHSWMKSSGNTLVLFEEVGADPTQLSFATRQVESLCSHVSESQPSPVDMWSSDSKAESKSRPRLSLECPFPNQVISSIKFASYGRPSGTCGSFSHGSCRSSRALSIVQKACVGSKSCSIEVSTNTFGDPCKGLAKSLAVEASCK